MKLWWKRVARQRWFQVLLGTFAAEYLRPDWIMDRVWRAAGEIRTGYIHLEGPAGTGKSFVYHTKASGRWRLGQYLARE